MVYFPRNFNLKPVLHNYHDLFKKTKVDRSGPTGNKRPLLRCFGGFFNTFFSGRHSFVFLLHFQNSDKMSCSAVKVVNPVSDRVWVKNSANVFNKTEQRVNSLHVLKAPRVTNTILAVLGASPGTVFHLNHTENGQGEPNSTVPRFWCNFTAVLKETFLCKATTSITGHSPRALLKKITGNIHKFVQLKSLNCL